MRGIVFVILAAGLALTAGPSSAIEADLAAIEKVVVRAYVEGIHIDRDPEKIRSGFHPDFVMFVNRDEGIVKVTREQWIARIEEGKRERPDAPRPEIRHEFSFVDVVGDAAVARVEIHRDGRHTFSDYLSLYRFEDGWRIIGKTFYSQPRDD